MAKNVFVFLLLSFFVLAVSRQEAFAQEKLYFNNSISDVQEALVAGYVRIHLQAHIDDFTIARTDLNYDGIFEFIVKLKDCGKVRELCDFHILAEGPKGDKVLSLGVISAYQVAGGNGSAHGIRDILAFQNELNDFSSVIYRWNEKSSQYQMTEKGK
ncbi:hypothetical protein N9Z27_01850 [Alphaproteobacteria bacterium]|nr:hypothetical protein [Alphaproteobacteria bacterium]